MTNMLSSQAQNLELNKYIDHTLLKPDANRAAIEKLCAEAKQYRFWSVCVNLSWARLAVDLLEGSGVKTCVVVGFPLGATTTLAKMFETDQAIQAGAREVDMVVNVGAIKSGLWDFVRDDIAGVLSSCRKDKRNKALLKVIIETALLTDDEKRATIGYGPKLPLSPPAGRATKINPYHDDRGRFDFAPEGGGDEDEADQRAP